MSYAPKPITDAMKVWTTNGGVNLGIVGNTRHVVGYHLGKDRIYDGSGPGIGDSDYSVKLARDKAGLTDAVAAMDLGRLDGTLANLQKFSKWLVARCKAGAPGTKDIREIIYSPDGVAVKRWDNNAKVLYNGGTGTGQGDDSHRTHTHISFFRDSQNRDKTILFTPYFEATTPPPTGDTPMPDITTYIPGYDCTIKATSNVRSTPYVTTGNLIRTIPAGSTETWDITGWVKGGVDAESGSDQWVTRWNNGKWEYTAKVNVISGPTAPAGAPSEASCKPYSDAAYANGYASGKTDGIAVGTVTGVAKGTADEQTRLKGVLGLK